MKNRKLILFLLIFLIFVHFTYSQQHISKKNSEETTALFLNKQHPLSIQLKLSIKNIKKNTNDSTYIASTLIYKNKAKLWDSLKIKMRARGNHRRKNCYYIPLKLKLKK